MAYILFTYALLLTIFSFYGYRQQLGISVLSVIISSGFLIAAALNFFYGGSVLKALLSLLILALSWTYFEDRRRTGKTIHYSHHLLRLLFHLSLIYFLYF